MAASRTKEVARVPSFTVEVVGRRIQVADAAEASQVVSEIRRRSGAGAAEMGDVFKIRENGRVVGYVSYNGKVWEGAPDRPQEAKLVYDPSATAAAEDIPARPTRHESAPRGSAVEVAREYAARLWKNTDDYMADIASHADFSARQREIWGQIEAAGADVHDEVLRLLRLESRGRQGG